MNFKTSADVTAAARPGGAVGAESGGFSLGGTRGQGSGGKAAGLTAHLLSAL